MLIRAMRRDRDFFSKVFFVVRLASIIERKEEACLLEEFL